MNKEQKQFKKAIKARRGRERRIRRMKSGWMRPTLKKEVVKVTKISLWRRLINWIWKKK
jgi:hypothetical protein